jgi:hypothetical protein
MRLYLALLLLLFFNHATWAIPSKPSTDGLYIPSSSSLKDVYVHQNYYHLKSAPNIQVLPSSALTNKYQDQLKLFFPLDQLLSIKNRLKIKASNTFLTDVFINFKKAPLRNDGRIYFDYRLPKFFKQFVYITFTTPDYEIITIKRKVIHFFVPRDIKNFKDRQHLIYLFNSKIIPNPKKKHNLSTPWTRADLAYFISLIKPPASHQTLHTSIEDVPSHHWAHQAISHVLHQKIMTEYPDGKFRPNTPITKIEYILSIIKAYRHPLERHHYPLAFEDISSTHWTAKYVRTALKHNLIPLSNKLFPQKKLSTIDFLDLIKDLPEVKDILSDLLSFEKGFHEDLAYKNKIIKHVKSHLLTKHQELANKCQFKIISPSPQQSFVFQNPLLIKGHIFPAQPFCINTQNITPQVNGHFTSKHHLKIGSNSFSFQALGQEHQRKLIFLPSYPDLQKHWLKKDASFLKHLHLIDQTPYFHPQKTISKSELSHYLLKLFQLNPSINDQLNIKDVHPKHTNYTAINTLINLAIFKLDKKQCFYPNKPVTRAEAITTVMRLLTHLHSLPPSTIITKLTFKDISSHHWAYGYLFQAVKYKLIKNSYYYYPNRLITKAELIAIIARTPIIRNKIDELKKQLYASAHQ